MSKFIIGPHMRLQEWVAERKAILKTKGSITSSSIPPVFSRLSVKSATELPKDQIKKAQYQTIEQGRTCDISSACHWTSTWQRRQGMVACGRARTPYFRAGSWFHRNRESSALKIFAHIRLQLLSVGKPLHNNSGVGTYPRT